MIAVMAGHLDNTAFPLFIADHAVEKSACSQFLDYHRHRTGNNFLAAGIYTFTASRRRINLFCCIPFIYWMSSQTFCVLSKRAYILLSMTRFNYNFAADSKEKVVAPHLCALMAI